MLESIKGDKVSSILMDYSNGIIKIYENLDTCVEYELSFLIHEIEWYKNNSYIRIYKSIRYIWSGVF